MRVDYAIEQLKSNTTDKLEEIGRASGFNSKTTFFSVFKKHTGITPGQMRENRSKS